MGDPGNKSSKTMNETGNNHFAREKAFLMDEKYPEKVPSTLVKPERPSWCGRRTFLERGLIVLFFLMAAITVFVVIMMATTLRHIRKEAETSSSQQICTTEDCVKTAARMLEAMDTTVDPCDDFFEYACGTWNRVNVIPDDRSSFNTFSKLRDDINVALKSKSGFVRNVEKKSGIVWNSREKKRNCVGQRDKSRSVWAKAKNLNRPSQQGLLEQEHSSEDPEVITMVKHVYQSCLNMSEIERRGDAPLRQFLDWLGGWPVLDPSWDETSFNWIEVAAKLRLLNNRVLINSWVSSDDKDSSVNVIQLDQSHLGMPSREYFLGARDDRILLGYETFAKDVAKLLGASEEDAETQMTQMLDFEIKLANITMPESERRDSEAIYHRFTVAELYTNISQEIDWLNYLNLLFANVSMNVSITEELVVYSPEYYRELTVILRETPKRIIANYLVWCAIFSAYKHDPFPSHLHKAKAQFHSVLYGTDTERARWKSCVSYTNDNFGMAVGRLFVERNFNEEAKSMAEEMIQNIRDSFSELLNTVEWMGEDTRRKAKEKADATQEKIGYPDYILNNTMLFSDYEGIQVDPALYFENVLHNLNFITKSNLRRLREPVDKTIWSTTPAVVNAFYSSTKNQIMFPAGILQPPFYSKTYPRSLNFGGIAMVIGHELTHGFDDRGRLFDKDGNLQQWWSQEDIDKFKARAQCMIDQYANYTIPEIGLSLNGKQTQGENIADNGGLKQSFKAYRNWVARQGHEELPLPGLNLTHDQLFFLNFAQIWCGTARPESYLQSLRSGTHSPGQFRVIGAVSNSYDFAKAYRCPVGSRMNSAKKCEVW